MWLWLISVLAFGGSFARGRLDRTGVIGLSRLQARAITLLAGAEMGAHRLARGFGIAGRDRVQDYQMLALQPALVAVGLRQFGRPGRGHVAWNGAPAEHVEHLDI